MTALRKLLPTLRQCLLLAMLFCLISPDLIVRTNALSKGERRKTAVKSEEAANEVNTEGKTMKRRLKKIKVKKVAGDKATKKAAALAASKSARDYQLLDSYGAPIAAPITEQMADAIHAAATAAAATAAATATAVASNPASHSYSYSYNHPSYGYSLPSGNGTFNYNDFYSYPQQPAATATLPASAAAPAASGSGGVGKTRVPRILSFFSGSKFEFNVKLTAPIPFCQFPGSFCKTRLFPRSLLPMLLAFSALSSVEKMPNRIKFNRT